MPTIIDQLVITLGLDTANFNEGQRRFINSLRQSEDAATRTSENVSRAGSRTTAFFRGLEHPIASLRSHFESLAGATVKPQQHLADLAAQGRRAGTGVESGALAGASGLRILGIASLAAFAAVTALNKAMTAAVNTAGTVFKSGLGAAGAGLGINEFGAVTQAVFAGGGTVTQQETGDWLTQWRQMQIAATVYADTGPQSEMIKNLALAGVTGLNPTDQNVTSENAMAAIATQFATMTKDQAVAAGRHLNMSDALSLRLRDQGPNFMRDVAAQRGLAPTAADSAAASDLLKAQHDLDIEWDNLSRLLMRDLEPALVMFTGWLTKVIGEITGSVEKHGILGAIPDTGAGELAPALGLTVAPERATGLRGWLQRVAPSWFGNDAAGATTGPQSSTAPGNSRLIDPRNQMSLVDPRVAAAAAAAAQDLPPGFRYRVTSGMKTHPQGTYTGGAWSEVAMGKGIDLALVDPSGKDVPYGIGLDPNSAAYKLQEAFARRYQAAGRALGIDPRWGGDYSETDPQSYGQVLPGFPIGARFGADAEAAVNAARSGLARGAGTAASGPGSGSSQNSIAVGAINIHATAASTATAAAAAKLIASRSASHVSMANSGMNQ